MTSPALLLLLFVAPADHFEAKVRPLLLSRCVECHGPKKQSGKLRLDTATGVARVVVPGKPEESLLLRAVRHEGELKMPLKGRLSDREIADLAVWVKSGAVWPGAAPVTRVAFTAEQKAFWSFRPVKAVEVPEVKARRAHAAPLAGNPIDAFLQAKLAGEGVGRRAFLRRITFGLTGLPPTPAEMDAFLADTSPDADRRAVDRLLSSPACGERWGRHWLDVARYAETTANDSNSVMRYAWRYRDWAVRAFNADLPHDRFIVEQLAGDLLPGAGADQYIATGFLMVGPKALAEPDFEQARLDIVDDQIDTTSRAFLGLTVSCARCHDHKFDPIPTLDYYSLAGIFRSTEPFRDEHKNAVMWQEYPLPGDTATVVMAAKEGKPVDLRVALRGNIRTPGAVAPRRFLQILAGEGHAPLKTKQSGRLELARWIASPENPLTARVMVNRIWMHHFGTGLVGTPDNFGARGDRPAHPELLDWLAGEFVRSGWSVKHMHRLILLSSAYRQTRPPRRLEAEAIRDAMLFVSGRLDRSLGGNDSGELLFKEGEVIDKKRDFFRPNQMKADHPVFTTSEKRSLYLPVIRNAVPDLFALFDGADPNAVTAAREDTTVASQALYLMNHPFVRGQALHFARRVLDTDAAKVDDGVKLAYRIALGRVPEEGEAGKARAFLSRYEKLAAARGVRDARLAAWQAFCQTLLCRNEFLYVD